METVKMKHRNLLVNPASNFTYIDKETLTKKQLGLIKTFNAVKVLLIKENNDTYFVYARNDDDKFVELRDQPEHLVNGYLTEIATRAFAEFITRSMIDMKCRCSSSGMVSIKPSTFDGTRGVVANYTIATSSSNKHNIDEGIAKMIGITPYTCSDLVTRNFVVCIKKLTYSPDNILYHLTLSLPLNEVLTDSAIIDITGFKYFYDDFNEIPPFKSNPPLMNPEGH